MHPEMRTNMNKPVHIDSEGRLFLDGEEFLYPVVADSVRVEQLDGGRNHKLTMTIIVGSVTMDKRPARNNEIAPEWSM